MLAFFISIYLLYISAIHSCYTFSKLSLLYILKLIIYMIQI